MTQLRSPYRREVADRALNLALPLLHQGLTARDVLKTAASFMHFILNEPETVKTPEPGDEDGDAVQEDVQDEDTRDSQYMPKETLHQYRGSTRAETDAKIKGRFEAGTGLNNSSVASVPLLMLEREKLEPYITHLRTCVLRGYFSGRERELVSSNSTPCPPTGQFSTYD